MRILLEIKRLNETDSLNTKIGAPGVYVVDIMSIFSLSPFDATLHENFGFRTCSSSDQLPLRYENDFNGLSKLSFGGLIPRLTGGHSAGKNAQNTDFYAKMPLSGEDL